jgi:hypothetical protein
MRLICCWSFVLLWQHYDWRSVAFDGIGKYCLEGLLGAQCQDALFRAFDALSAATTYVVTSSSKAPRVIELLFVGAKG